MLGLECRKLSSQSIHWLHHTGYWTLEMASLNTPLVMEEITKETGKQLNDTVNKIYPILANLILP